MFYASMLSSSCKLRLQYTIGLILQQWPSQDGHYPTIAYQIAFSFNLGLQIAALAWFEFARVAQIFFRPFARLATNAHPCQALT
jgi:hypothetical protein